MWRFGLLFILVISFCAVPTWALPLGAKEAFMANTGIGLAGSPGAVIYNPAGQAALSHPRISADTGFLYYSDALESSSQSDVSVGGRSVYSTLETVPGLLVSAFPTSSGVWSISLLVPYRSEVTITGQQDLSQFISSQTGNVSFSTTQRDESVNLGFTYATHLSSNWLIGNSLYIARDLSGTQTSFYYNDSSSSQGFSRELQQQTISYGLKDIFGLMYRTQIHNHLVDFGFNVHLPTWYFNNQTSSYYSNTQYFSSTYSGAENIETDSGPNRTPWQFGFGFSTQLTPKIMLLADCNYVTESTGVYQDNNGNFQRTQLSNSTDAGVGAIFTYYKNVEIRAGYRYEQALRPSLQAGLNRSFSYIASGGIHFVNPNFDTGVGLFFENDTADYSTAGISTSDPHRTQILSLALLLSGEYRL